MEEKLNKLEFGILDDLKYENSINDLSTLNVNTNINHNNFLHPNFIKQNSIFDLNWDSKKEERIFRSHNKIKSERKNIISCETLRYIDTERILNNKFNNIKHIGKGNFSSVFSGVNKIDNKEYIIKKFRNSNNFEALIYGYFKKTNINCLLKYYDSWIENNYRYLVLEKCDFSLYNLYENGENFNEKYILNILKDISLCLINLHKHYFVHFDVKPENILKKDNGKFVLIDFNLSKNYKYDYKKNNKDFEEGDIKYFDKNLLDWTYENKYLPNIDIYSLGISIFHLIENKNNLPTSNCQWKKLKLNINERINNLSINDKLKDLLISMTNPNPTLRPSAKKIYKYTKYYIKNNF